MRSRVTAFVLLITILVIPALTAAQGPPGGGGTGANLQSRVTALEAAIASLQTTVASLTTTVSSLQIAVTGLQAAVSALQGQVSVKFLALLSAGDEVAVPAQPLLNITFDQALEAGVVPGMTASFQMPSAGCVTATFSAEILAPASSNSNMNVFRAVLDGTPMKGVSTSELTATTLGFTGGEPTVGVVVVELFDPFGIPIALSFTFWECGVSGGSHTITIQAVAPVGTTNFNQVGFRARTLLVQGGPAPTP